MAQKTAFEAKGRQHIAVKEFNIYLTLIYIHTQRFIAIGKANGKSSTFTIKNNWLHSQIVWAPCSQFGIYFFKKLKLHEPVVLIYSCKFQISN